MDRILTSGRENKAIYGLDLIKELVSKSRDRISIMAGSGINCDNVRDVINKTGVKEVHLSAKKNVDSVMKYRNNKVIMIGKINEYENYLTSEKLVKSVFNKLNEV